MSGFGKTIRERKCNLATTPWDPEKIQLDRPNVARVFDYMLGGHHNFEADRQAGDKFAELMPNIRMIFLADRAFLRRAVRLCVAQGIDQFLDIGSGLPTVANTHTVAQEENPEARVVYVDIDRIAVGYSRHILEHNPRATAIVGDVTKPQQIIDHPEVQELLDFERPMGILFVALLHMVPDDELAYNSVYTFRDQAASGSYIAISHATDDGPPLEVVEGIRKLYSSRSGIASKMRSRAEVRDFFKGLELLDPGVVFPSLWRPEADDLGPEDPSHCLSIGGVGRKP